MSAAQRFHFAEMFGALADDINGPAGIGLSRTYYGFFGWKRSFQAFRATLNLSR
jgi:hypothetical protein